MATATTSHTPPASSMSHAQGGTDSHGHGGSHVVSLGLLGGIFAVLMVLTFLTVAVTEINLGYTGNLVLALAIAVVKALLVMLYFMHLRWDSPFNAMIATAALLFIAIFIVACITDTGQYQSNVANFTNQVPVGSGALAPR